MNLCSSGHDEVCFESHRCPVCEMESNKNDRIRELEDDKENLERQISELEAEVKNLTSQLDG